MNSPIETPQVSASASVSKPGSAPGQSKRRAKLLGSLIALAIAAAIGGLAWYLTHPAAGADGASAHGGPGARGGAGGQGGPSTTVGVARAEKSDIPVLLDALGTVTAQATVTVHPQVSGILQKILFQEGQMVQAGQVLAIIDPSQFQLALQQASGARLRDEAQLESARVTLARFQTLLGQDSIARQDVDTQAALSKQLAGTVMMDRAVEGTARLNLAYTKVLAPSSGRVGLRAVDVGNLVNPGDASGLVVITQLTPIDVTFAVPQDQVPALQARVGDGVTLPALALDRTRSVTLDQGRFAALDNVVDVQTGTVRAKARFANAKQTLFPSQFVNLQLELSTIKDAVMVPVTALRHGSSGDFVYVLNTDHTVALRPIVSGQSTRDKVQIKSGLQAGEQVITEGADRLKDGAKVTLPGDKPFAGRRGGHTGSASASATDGATPVAAGAHQHRRRDAAAAAADGASMAGSAGSAGNSAVDSSASARK